MMRRANEITINSRSNNPCGTFNRNLSLGQTGFNAYFVTSYHLNEKNGCLIDYYYAVSLCL